MAKNIQPKELNAVIDMPIESEGDLLKVLGKKGLIKQVSKCILKGSLGAEMQSQLELRTL
jgi:hypothetical protein